MNQQLLISEYKGYIKHLLHRQYIRVEKKRKIYKMVCNMDKEIERLNTLIKDMYKIFENGNLSDGCDCRDVEHILDQELKGNDN